MFHGTPIAATNRARQGVGRRRMIGTVTSLHYVLAAFAAQRGEMKRQQALLLVSATRLWLNTASLPQGHRGRSS
jgi:hypothetical protein